MKKTMCNALIDCVTASLLSLLIYILADLIFIAPALMNSIDDKQSFLYTFAMTLHYVIAFVPFFCILLVAYIRKRQPKAEYLKQMAGRPYEFATDVKELLQGDGKWYLAVFAAVEVLALVVFIAGVPTGALLTATMPMASVWLAGTTGVAGAMVGFAISFVLFFVIVLFGITRKHRKWCAERLSV